MEFLVDNDKLNLCSAFLGLGFPIDALERLRLCSSEKAFPFLLSLIFFLLSSEKILPNPLWLIFLQCSSVKTLPFICFTYFLSRFHVFFCSSKDFTF